MIHDIPTYQRFLLGTNLLLSVTTNAAPSTAKGSLIAVTDATGGAQPDPVISGHVEKYIRTVGAAVGDAVVVAVKLYVEGVTGPVFCVRSANKWTVCRKITTKSSSTIEKINPEPGDTFKVKPNLADALIACGYSKDEALAMHELLVGIEQTALDVRFVKPEYWVTVGEMCEIPVKCCELITDKA